MQTPYWYVRRLRAMSRDELVWRVHTAARDRVDRVRIAFDLHPTDPGIERHARELADPAPPLLCDVAPGSWSAAGADRAEQVWTRRLLGRADAIAAHDLEVFGEIRSLGSPIDWNRDAETGKRVPLGFAQAIDYRDVRVAGDAKVVWEPNRHQHLLVLARAYRATGESRYAAAVIEQLTSWLDQCPFGRGMNWRSPLELAIRVINWVWTIDFIRDSGCLARPFCDRFAEAVYLHLWEISRRYSRGSSANNHLIGEAAGMFVGASYFSQFARAAAWRDTASEILVREIGAQTYPDGGTREQATRYQLFVWQLCVAAAIVGRRTGREFPPAFWARLERMLEFNAALSEGGPLPAFGDSDDGYVLDLGRTDDLTDALCVGAVLFDRADFKITAPSDCETARWMLGGAADVGFDRLPNPPRPSALQSRPLADSGYYVLQCGAPAEDAISVIFDCGPLGFSSLAAHGHADALSVVVRAFGREILTDPGTFDYFTHREWREYFRSTRAHNTVTVDGLDQSVQGGLFLFERAASAVCVEWNPQHATPSVAGRHDGYHRLNDPVDHLRRVTLDPAGRRVQIQDELAMRAEHTLTWSFHVAEGCDLVPQGEHQYDIHAGSHVVRLELDRRLAASVIHAGDVRSGGWVSRAYHTRTPTSTIVGELRAAANIQICTVLYCHT